jgi:2'-hydroxyisoflavone reductase
MQILVVGGTSFVGRAIAFAAFNSGHEVTVINRGITPTDLPSEVKRLVGDRQSDLSALAGLNFDVTIDSTAYRPIDVEVLANVIGKRGGHHIQISSISAYETPKQEGATEATAHLWPTAPEDPNVDINAQTYGPLKAACERAADKYFSEKLTIVRPTYVIGSHDVTLRFPYWVARSLKGGQIAVPGPRTNALQYIDARDLGEFVVNLAQSETIGDFHTVAPFPAGRYLDVIMEVAGYVSPPQTEIVEISPKLVLEQNLAIKFPLWSGESSFTASAVNPAKAISAGLKYRSLKDSVEDVIAWWGNREWHEKWLTADEENLLLTN